MTTPRFLVQRGMRLMRHPGSLVLAYEDERIPTGEPLVVTHVSRRAGTVTFWLETSERMETVYLREIVTPDFTSVGREEANLSRYTIAAAAYSHGERIPVEVGSRLIRTGRPFPTFDDQVPYDLALTVTNIEYEEYLPGVPTADFIEFVCAQGEGFINGVNLTTGNFTLVVPEDSP